MIIKDIDLESGGGSRLRNSKSMIIKDRIWNQVVDLG